MTQERIRRKSFLVLEHTSKIPAVLAVFFKRFCV